MHRAALLVPILLGSSLLAGNIEWPEWRGPGGRGHADPSARNLPATWSETENVAWKCPLPGRGWSSPVIACNQVWMTTALETEASPEDAERRLKTNTGDQPLTLMEKVDFHALCVDRSTGRLLHDIPLLSER